MKENERFIEIHREGNPLTTGCTTVFVDRETGVNYIFVQSGYAGGLTPLLNSEGKPIITKQ